jgi:hypothetical protein
MKIQHLLENTADALLDTRSMANIADGVRELSPDAAMGEQQLYQWKHREKNGGAPFAAPLAFVAYAAREGHPEILREIADRAGYAIAPKRTHGARERITSLLASEMHSHTEFVGATLEAMADGKITREESEEIRAMIQKDILQLQRLDERIATEAGA